MTERADEEHPPKPNLLQRWDLTAEELTEIVDSNPSLRGFLFGYVSEYKLRTSIFSDSRISNLRKYDDHDRTKKGDMAFEYKGVEVRVEVKSLQSNTVKQVNGEWVGVFQCDASDRRTVVLPTGKRIETTCLVVGEFDLLAVNLFHFGGEVRFAFARNEDLPRTRSHKYAPEDRPYLLATSMHITWPLTAPYEAEPFALLDRIAEEKARSGRPEKVVEQDDKLIIAEKPASNRSASS